MPDMCMKANGTLIGQFYLEGGKNIMAEQEVRVVAYARVSSKDQNEERQINVFNELGIRDIYVDKKSGKDFDREQYNVMKASLRKNDLVVIKSIDRLGRNYEMVRDEWRDITKGIGANIRVIDMPMLDTSNKTDLIGNVITNIVLDLLSYVAEQERAFIKQRQSEGIANALKNGVKFGRKTKTADDIPFSFYKYYTQYKKKQINLVELSKLAGCCRNTCYNYIKVIEGS